MNKRLLSALGELTFTRASLREAKQHLQNLLSTITGRIESISEEIKRIEVFLRKEQKDE